MQEELKQLKTVEHQNHQSYIRSKRTWGLIRKCRIPWARERQSFVEGRVGELEDVISRAEVIDPSMIDGKTVTFGTTIVVADEDTDEENTYTIVGPYEVIFLKLDFDFFANGNALIGKKVGLG